jgi:hypothetical protein
MLPGNPRYQRTTRNYDFRQHLVFDTRKIRARLGYRDLFDEAEAMRRLALMAR